MAVLTCVIALLSMSLLACTDDKDGNKDKGDTPAPTPARTYSVTYDKGATDATGSAPETKKYEKGATVTLAPASTFQRAGYSFTKWTDGTTDYDAGASFTMPEKNVTFTAKWETVSMELTSANVVVDGASINLVVTGNTNQKDAKLFVGGDLNDANKRFVDITTDNDGNFTATLDLATMALSTDWYNARIYYAGNSAYYNIGRNEVKFNNEDISQDQQFVGTTRKIIIHSYPDGGKDTFSFEVGAVVAAEVTSMEFDADGQFIVKISSPGTTLTATYEDKENILNATVTKDDDLFVVTFDPSGCSAKGAWYKFFVQVDGGDKAQLPYPTGANVNDITYVDAGLLREYYLVTDYDNKEVALAFRKATIAPEGITTTNIVFDGSNLVVTLTAPEEAEISACYIEGSDPSNCNEKFEATVTKDGTTFTITFDVTKCTAQGSWYKLFMQVDAEAPVAVLYPTTVDVAAIIYVDATANREYYLTTEWDTKTVSLVFRPATSD